MVFKNAITFNTMRDHPVHVAAKELSYKFEERFRHLMTQFLSAGSTVAAGFQKPIAGAMRPGGGAFPNRPPLAMGGPKKSKAKPGVPGQQTWRGRPAASAAGPRSMDAYLPPAVDVNAAHLLEMQKRIKELEEEVLMLRTQLRQQEIKSTLESQRLVFYFIF